MARLVVCWVLILTLVALHSSSAFGIWPFGERSSSNQANSDIPQVSFGSYGQNLPVNEQYYQNEIPQQVANGHELVNQQSHAEHKDLSYGSTGVAGLTNQQTPIAVNPYFGQVGQNDFLNAGYIENVPNLSPNQSTNAQPKFKFRSLFPWNWYFSSPTTQPANSPQENAQQPIQGQPAPSRRGLGWSFYPPNQAKSSQQHCQCWTSPSLGPILSPSYTYTYPPIYQGNNIGETGTQSNQQEQTNVREVNSSEDHNGLASNANAQYVSAPQQTVQQTQPVQSVPSIPISSSLAQPSQLPVEQGSHLSSTGTNEQQLSIPQQTPQQLIYQATYANANPNPQTIPATNNYSSGDVAKNSQTLALN